MSRDPGTGWKTALIIGQGRSGTNMLLGLLDLSPLTHCRNEPNAIAGCAFATLESQRFHLTDPSFLEERWDAVVDRSARSVGLRDPKPPRGKSWARPWAEATGAFGLHYRRRLRHWMGAVAPRWRGNEIGLASATVRNEALEQALHVFKLNASSGLAEWVLDHRPDAKVIHIVRHPGGFARSWMTRWLKTRDAGDVARLNLERLEQVRRHDPAFPLPADLAALSPLESELWFWRWCNECVAEAGEGRSQYRRLLYERVTEQPVETCRELYGYCGLPWSESIAAGVRRETEHSEEIAGAWRSDLAPDAVASVRKVIAGSTMEGWWGDA